MARFLKVSLTARTRNGVNFVVPKKLFPTAVSRNTIKRRIRAALREISLPKDKTILIRCLPGTEQASVSELRQELQSFFKGQ